MQAANTLFFSISLQRNKQALFLSFSFAQPAKTSVQQRTAHYVATIHNKHATTAQVMQLVAAQQIRDKALNVCNCNTTAMHKLLRKNDLHAA